MKNLLMLAVGIIVMIFSVSAQKIDASKVPAAVKESFAKQFPGAAAKWEKEDGKFEAGFKQNGNSMSSLFEANGTMTESEMEIKVSELPVSVADYVKTNYKGIAVKGAAKITKANGEVNYEAELKGKDLIFDAAGNFLKEVKD
jgi:Putative beta-lactamase-inhibitor-like, PepSY-like